MSAPIAIRDATIDDLYLITAQYAHHVAHGTGTFEELSPTLETMQEYWRDVLDAGLSWLAAEIDREIVGFGYAGPWKFRSAYRFRSTSRMTGADRASGGRCWMR